MLFFAVAFLAATTPLTYTAPIGSCPVGNTTYMNGEILTIPGFPPCSNYQCVNGMINPYSSGCESNGACKAVNSTWVYNCRTYACSMTVQGGTTVYSTNIISSKCTDANGVCRSPGETFPYVINGQSYSQCTCSIDASGTINYSCTGPCVVNGYTFQNGEIFTVPGYSPCIKYQCISGVSKVIEEACNSNGACRPLNSNWTVNCRTYTCTKSVQDTTTTYSTSLVSSQCVDAFGACRNPGEIFSYVIAGHLYTSCSCLSDSTGRVQYGCTG